MFNLESTKTLSVGDILTEACGEDNLRARVLWTGKYPVDESYNLLVLQKLNNAIEVSDEVELSACLIPVSISREDSNLKYSDILNVNNTYSTEELNDLEDSIALMATQIILSLGYEYRHYQTCLLQKKLDAFNLLISTDIKDTLNGNFH